VRAPVTVHRAGESTRPLDRAAPVQAVGDGARRNGLAGHQRPMWGRQQPPHGITPGQLQGFRARKACASRPARRLPASSLPLPGGPHQQQVVVPCRPTNFPGPRRPLLLPLHRRASGGGRALDGWRRTATTGLARGSGQSNRLHLIKSARPARPSDFDQQRFATHGSAATTRARAPLAPCARGQGDHPAAPGAGCRQGPVRRALQTPSRPLPAPAGPLASQQAKRDRQVPQGRPFLRSSGGARRTINPGQGAPGSRSLPQRPGPDRSRHSRPGVSPAHHLKPRRPGAMSTPGSPGGFQSRREGAAAGAANIEPTARGLHRSPPCPISARPAPWLSLTRLL